jgi:molybdopterin-containing oxidoreductase family iron-sulfur binding subunit
MPLFGGHTLSEVWGCVLGEPLVDAHAQLQELWRKNQKGVVDFDTFWERTLQAGFVPKSAPANENVRAAADGFALAASKAQPASAGELELNLFIDGKVLDGRFGNNPWLQELPDPITKITWTNAVILSPRTAGKLGLALEDEVEVRMGEQRIRLPVYVLPGHVDDAVSIALGYGRAGAEEIATGVGGNANLLRTSQAPWRASGVTLTRVGHRELSITQDHWSMEGRPIALDTTLAEEMREPGHTVEGQRGDLPSMYSTFPYEGYRWAMAIDLSKCTGCSACVVACQSENNVAVVGAEQVRKGRTMQWLRIDRYFAGDENDPSTVNQPVACVHCENAPCEYVCPVNATVHSDEGLNEMVYNRCVGTRYCSNNCPYKVRRFNFFDYTSQTGEFERMHNNPDVSVRSRGVMEKCTYCVQRIERARITTRIAGRQIRDGELRTACQQTCPTQAITFGSLHEDSMVSKAHADPRRYDLLHDLGTRPRTAYLTKVRNPNPELASGEGRQR